METATALPSWIADTNRFNLPEPPEWVQRAIYDFDAQLVIIPSRTARQYILARRRLYSANYGQMVMTSPAPNTQMFYDHGLIDVAPLKWPGYWSQAWVGRLLSELRARDTWAAGGPENFVKIVEDHEASAEIRKRRTMRDDFEHRARDAWRSLQARTGQRNRRASNYHGVARSTL